MQSVTVFCGSSAGFDDAHNDAVVAIASALVARNVTVVYGGASVGSMGVLADTSLALGGRVVGVLPRHLSEKEIGHAGLTEMHLVESMHERKALMTDLSDGFIALPGGFGTLDELFEVLTWAQLGAHNKPIGLLNTRGYFDPLLAFIDHTIAEGFVRSENRDLLLVETDPAALLDAMECYKPAGVSKWIDKSGGEVPVP
jgi:uncharacterized protein (TIGR00730 family)